MQFQASDVISDPGGASEATPPPLPTTGAGTEEEASPPPPPPPALREGYSVGRDGVATSQMQSSPSPLPPLASRFGLPALNCRAGTGPACLARRARRTGGRGEEEVRSEEGGETKDAASQSAIEPSASPPAMTPSGCCRAPASEGLEDPAVPHAREAKRSGAEAPAAAADEEAGRRSGESEARSTEKTF